MIDLNALRVFEKVATLRSFSAAARTLELPKSSVSRSVAALETALGTRLFQRTKRDVVLTESGVALRDRCADLLARIDETVDYVTTFGSSPRGVLRIAAGVGFGVNILADLIPRFILQYPDVDVVLDLSSEPADLVAKSVDVAIRIGPLPSSDLVVRRLGSMNRYLCAAPSYLARRGAPRTLAELRDHDAVELFINGRARPWIFTQPDGQTASIDPSPRVRVNEALTIYRLVLNGAGIGCISAYVCGPDVAAGRLVQLFPDCKLPSLDVSVVFPTNRKLAPAVRAFVDFIKGASLPGTSWQSDPLSSAA
ncbi:MAG TPA: LysR family transcriptional regulator [Kofleriaceae bacterium]|jgi:DNA-binding transcriptional LysR family regulator